MLCVCLSQYEFRYVCDAGGWRILQLYLSNNMWEQVIAPLVTK